MAITQRERQELTDKVRNVYPHSFVEFAGDMWVPLGGNVGRFRDAWVEPQQRIINALSPSLVANANGQIPPIGRFWLEMTKGFGKDLICTLATIWLLLYSRQPARVQFGADDKRQASEPIDIARHFVSIDAPLNRFVASRIDVQRDKIVAKPADGSRRGDSVAEVLTNDCTGEHGSRPSMIVCNEVSHISNESFLYTMADNGSKVPSCVFLYATNAGLQDHFSFRLRQVVLETPKWFKEITNCPPPWMTADALEDSRLRNPPARHNRYFYGVWSTSEGDGLDMAKVEKRVVLPGPARRNASRIFIGGIDLGIRSDHSSICTVSVDPLRQVVELADVQSWAPQDFASGQVELSAVESAALELRSRYGVVAFFYDPYQCEMLAQRLRQHGLLMIDYPFTPANKDVMTNALINAFNSEQISLYRDPALMRDLSRIRIKEASHGGLRIDSVRDADGHADRAIALSIVLPHAIEVANSGLSLTGGRVDDVAEVLIPA